MLRRQSGYTMMNTHRLSVSLAIGASAISLLLAACGNKAESGPAPAASGASAPVTGTRAGGAPIAVTTVAATRRDFDVTLEAIGTVTPIASVDVKPQINSVITQVHVKEGQFVKTGERLFTLDVRPDEANVAKARAQVAKDQAVLEDAQRQLARNRDLLVKGFISQGAVDSSQANVDSQKATVLSSRAALDAAQLALSYTSVRASGAGRLGAVNVYPGTSVQANQTSLVTITQLDPINISFNLPQRSLDAVLQGLKSGGAQVSATLPDAKTDIKGRLQFVDNAVDASTGTIKVKARFDNREAKLWPGAFVKIALISDTLKDAVVIPTAAVIQSARGSVVYVAEKSKAVLRPVKVVAAQGEFSAVTGVSAGERIVLEGRQNLRPDASVVERAAPASAPARAPASAAP